MCKSLMKGNNFPGQDCSYFILLEYLAMSFMLLIKMPFVNNWRTTGNDA